MTKENKNPNVPNLRFMGFSEIYITNKLGSLVDSCGGGTPSAKNIDFWNGNIPWISSSDIEENNIQNINITRFITSDAINNSATKLCPPNSIHIVSRVGVGKVAVSSEALCTSQDFFNITKFNGNHLYLAHLLQIKLNNTQSQGTSIKGITSKDLKALEIKIPSVSEQNKIASFLSKIDEQIQTQIKIISSLESQRKGIISFLLKQLKSFNELSLSEILIEFNKKTTTNNEFPVLSSTASGIHLQSDYFNKGASSDDTTGYKILPKNYGTYRSMSDTGRFNFNQQTILDYGIVSPAYPVFYSNTYNLSFVILYLNNSSEIKKQILELKTGGTRFALSFQKLCTLNIPNISLKQQNNVMQIINSIDLKIQNENNLLNLYNRQKDYLLNNLFV